jgi:hypothetical protein
MYGKKFMVNRKQCEGCGKKLCETKVRRRRNRE